MALRVTLDLSALASGLVAKNRPLGLCHSMGSMQKHSGMCDKPSGYALGFIKHSLVYFA